VEVARRSRIVVVPSQSRCEAVDYRIRGFWSILHNTAIVHYRESLDGLVCCQRCGPNPRTRILLLERTFRQCTRSTAGDPNNLLHDGLNPRSRARRYDRAKQHSWNGRRGCESACWTLVAGQPDLVL